VVQFEIRGSIIHFDGGGHRIPDGAIGVEDWAVPPFVIEVGNSHVTDKLARKAEQCYSQTRDATKSVPTVKWEHWDAAEWDKMAEELKKNEEKLVGIRKELDGRWTQRVAGTRRLKRKSSR
jgi:hypothetical protein